MSRRHFAETSVREEGQPVPRYRLVCGTCGCGETLGRMNFGQAVADTQVPKKFEDKGWRVGKRHDGRDDLCPACVNREQEARRRRLHVVQSEECVPVAQPTPISSAGSAPARPAAPAAEKPREMTRDERRLIWAKLEEVYIDERAGYSAGWSDARVSEDLGIPRAWVSTIRDENFGPGVSEDVEKAMAEAKVLTAEAAEFRKAMEALTARGAEILKRADAVDRTVKRIETAIR
ncbi:hypothetical protein [Methylobacterium sp. Leaf108]|uniref:hypothetical protein n=1 Tax=Methylobacterium sp. Leaf108 TaxID=1736256 RepID=UPI0006F62738|nr:hypothetical protein [Methylobacterium sp. Leaf108]KQP61074.1 hypothetical protein ASF39_15495 [Methylobacterium sp. Leaf108]